MTDRDFSALSARLEGRLVTMEPLGPEHEDDLHEAAADAQIWPWMAIDASDDDGFARWWAHALEQAARGNEVVFATVQRETGRAVGSTRFLALRPEHRGAEIGHTWLAPSMWRTGANVEAKLLMLRHAFETVGCMRIEFKTDARNERSRRALEALPARFEGIFRKHMLVVAGVRDSAYYAITDDEWPDVKTNLERRLEERRG